MRLLRRSDTGDFSLIQFRNEAIPFYAIFSHTWGADDEEVTFDDLTNGTGKDKPGYEKIRFCGEQAALDDLEYFWIDTCCIDKTSSAELSEAINSMYQWYKGARVCYAYLSDVGPNGLEFSKSRWFSRGWTLQELIAPSSLKFFGKGWYSLGSKGSHIVRLFEITGIHPAVLMGKEPGMCSISQRMSWAARRQTTRLEDMAYCLMGILDINMPLLYGEGSKSFIGLQQEIMEDSDDHSLFAWRDPTAQGTSESGLLAWSPSHFVGAQHLTPLVNGEFTGPYAMTNKGLSLQLQIKGNPKAAEVQDGQVFPAIRNCCNKSPC